MACIVPCKNLGLLIAFKVDMGFSSYYFVILIKYQAGEGVYFAVELE